MCTLYSSLLSIQSVQFSSVSQSCLILCDHLNHSTPGLTVHHQLQESTQTHVDRVSDAIQPSYPVIPFSSCLQSFPASGSLLMSQLFTSSGQNTGVLASTSVFPVNSQDWSPLRWTGWISLQSKGLSRAREFQKNIYFCFIDYAKAFDCVDHSKLENGERDGNTRPRDLPLEKPICRSGRNSENWTWNNRLVPNRKRSMSGLYIVTLLILCRVHREKCWAG